MEHELDEAVARLEKVNADLSPGLYSKARRRSLLERYARLEKLAAFGKAALAAQVGDAAALARVTGTSVGRARQTIETGRRLEETPQLGEAVRHGEVSLDQAEEIAKTEAVRPGSVDRLLETARTDSFHVLKDEARRLRLEALAGPGLAERQHEARALRHRVTDLGMIHLEAELEPHIGVPIINRLEAHARRLAEAARRAGNPEPIERHLADSLPDLLTGKAGRSGRPEMVVLVSHEVAKRGWTHVEDNEFCKIPGIGPIDPPIAKQIAEDAFLTGLFYDGKDLRHIRRWTRNIPTDVKSALRLGKPPDFEGPKCVDCGNRLRIELDHRQPHAAGGPASTDNLDPRCEPCHDKKTVADRKPASSNPRETRSGRRRDPGYAEPSRNLGASSLL